MSFSLDCKQEIIDNKAARVRRKEGQAYGLFLFGARFDGDEISLRTECEGAAGLFQWLAVSLLGKGTRVERREKMLRGKALHTALLPDRSDRLRLLERFGGPGDRIRRENLKTNEDVGAFLAGAFLACGNITDPEKGYHLEFVVRQEGLCRDLMALLEETIPGVKETRRRDSRILYYKEYRQIEDLLALMGASKGSLAVIEVEMIKDVRNRANRATNCETANIDKMVTAATSQIDDIRLLLETVGEAGLPEGLRLAARLRLDNPDLSLRELAEISPAPISRSGMHHRLAALSRLAAEIREREETHR